MVGESKNINIDRNSFIHLFNGSSSAVTLSFNNKNTSERPERKGFRSGTMEKKNPKKRIVLIIDIEPSDEEISSITEGIMKKMEKKCASDEKIKELEGKMLSERNLPEEDIDFDSLASGLIR